MGTVKLYLDNELVGSEFVEVQPSESLSVDFTVRVERPGLYVLRAEFSSMGSSSTKTEIVTVPDDSDCDGWTDYVEEQYGTDPNNPDMDKDGVLDSRDVDPFKNVEVTVYVLRAKALDDLSGPLKLEINVNGVKKVFDLSLNKNDVEKKPLVGSDLGDPEGFTLRDYLESYSIAKLTVDVPDDEASGPIRFHLYTIDNSGLKSTVRDIDVSPGKGTIATIVYDLRNGTWSGDDYPGDAEKYFGYGHLSGCGDGSCNVGPKEPDKDIKVYTKYEGILEKKGIKGKILNITTVKGVKEIRITDGRGTRSILNPGEVKIATVRLENGSVVNVTLINTYKANAPVKEPIKLPVNPDVPLTKGIPANESVKAENTIPEEPLKGEVEIIPLEGDLIDPGLGDVITYSSELDGELWFVVTTNDRDFIPFYREIELNNELLGMGLSPAFNPKFDTQLDRDGDYDGDGVPNAVEVLIGKDPAKRDILGIELTVSVEWKMSDEDKEKLVYSIRKASDFIYDYTDGYAMIARVTIWDDKKNWDKADIQIHNGSCIVGVWNKKICPQTFSVGGYWIHRDMGIPEKFRLNVAIEMPREFASLLRNMEHLKEYITECTLRYGLTPEYIEPCVLSKLGRDKVKIGSVDYGKALAHELGHYVFILGDEYMDWKGRNYYTYDLFDPNKLIFRSDAWWFYTNNVPPYSVMNNAHRYSELSWPADYERFENKLKERFKNWEEHMTDQWGNTSNYREYSNSVRHEPGWNTLYKVLTLWNGTIWVEDPDKKGTWVGFGERIANNIKVEIKDIDNYIPKTGPYTGVGYFMEVTWG
ncbi:conserved hypothetical protein [Thermococcus sp. AM4]|nr:conserved hypothetical protein [Thermococcus sp. AM4]